MIHLNSGSIIQLAYQREIMFYFGYQPANQEKNTFQTGFFSSNEMQTNKPWKILWSFLYLS